MRPLRACCVAVWIVLAAGVPRGYGQSDISIAGAQSALGGRYKVGSILPMEVVVTNKGAPVTVRLVAQPKGAQSRSSVEKQVTIGSGSFRHFLYLNVDVPVTTMDVTMYSTKGRELDAVSPEVPDLPEEYSLIGFCGATKPVIGAIGEKGLEGAVVSVSAPSLPDHWIGLSALDSLVVSDLDPNTVSLSAQAALRRWVARGGTLVLVGGARYQYLEHPFYREFLPVQITGSRQVSALDGVAAVTGQGTAWHGDAPIVLCECRHTQGRAVAEEGRLPLVVERDYGIGRVLFLAFDPGAPALRRWPQRSDFWRRVLGVQKLDEEESGKVYTTDVSNVLTACLRSGHNDFSFLWVALFIIAYIVIAGPVDYLVLKRLGKLTLTWVTFPSYILVFSLVGYWLAYSAKGGDMLITTLSVLDVDADTRCGYGTTYFSFFSPKNGTYVFPVGEGDFMNEVVDPSRLGGQRVLFVREGVALHEDPPQWLVEARVNIWSMKYFRSFWQAGQQDGVISALSCSSKGDLGGSVKNATDYTITAVALLYKKHVYYPTISKMRGVAPGGEIDFGRSVKSVDVEKTVLQRLLKGFMPYHDYHRSPVPVLSSLVAMTAAPAFREIKELPREVVQENPWVQNMMRGKKTVRIRRAEGTNVTNLGDYLLRGRAILIAQIKQPLHEVTVEGWTHKDKDHSFIRQVLDVRTSDR